MIISKSVNLYPKPHVGKSTREIAVSSSAVQFEGVPSTLEIGDDTNYITFTSVAKNDAANNITVAYVQAEDTTTVASVSGQAITVEVGYQPLTASSLSTNLTGANNDLTFTAVEAGEDGDLISITYADPSENDAELSVEVSGSAIQVNLATGPSGAITSTASQVKAALEASEDASALISVALKTGNTGAGVVTALSETHLAGGEDAALVGTLANIKSAIEADEAADALVTCVITGTDSTVPDLIDAQKMSGAEESFAVSTPYVLLNVKANSVYVTFDGTTPSSTNGIILPSGYLQVWSRQAAAAASFLKNSGDARVTGSPFTD